MGIAIDLSKAIGATSPNRVGFGSSTFGAMPGNSSVEATLEKNLDARTVRLPVGVTNGRVTSSAGGGPRDLDIAALAAVYRSWGFNVLAICGDITLSAGQPTQIMKALGSTNILYSTPNEPGDQGKTAADVVAWAKLMLAEGKTLDPSLKVVGPAWSWLDVADIVSFASGVGQSNLAAIDYHGYAMGGSTYLDTDNALAQTVNYTNDIAKLTAALAAVGIVVPIIVSEMNLSWSWQNGAPGNVGEGRFFTAVNTVWMASAIGHILSSGAYAVPYAAQNGPLSLTYQHGNTEGPVLPDCTTMPAYWGMASWTGAKLFPHFKDTFYAVTGAVAGIEAYAVNNEAGGYNLVLINKSQSSTQSIGLKVIGGAAIADYDLFQTVQSAPFDPMKKLVSTRKVPSTLAISSPPMTVTVVVLNSVPVPGNLAAGSTLTQVIAAFNQLANWARSQ